MADRSPTTAPAEDIVAGVRPHAGHELVRDLSLRHASAVVVGTMIGTAIFLVPREMMEAVGSLHMVYLAWVVGGILSFAGALTYAELGAMKPEAGGDYVYMRDGYGPLGGFLYAWTTFLIARPASLAAIAIGIVRILGTFNALGFLPVALITVPLRITSGQLLAVGLSALVSYVNYIGVRRAGEFQVAFMVLKITVVLAVIVAAFSFRGGTAANLATTYSAARGGLDGFMIALMAALFAYDGWADLNAVAGEVRQPGRNVPLALMAGLTVAAVLYLLITAAVQYVLPAANVAGSFRPATDAVQMALGPAVAAVFAMAIAVQSIGTLNGSTLAGARFSFALARDGLFFRVLADVHPRYRTPANAIIFQQVLVTVLILLGGSFQQLFSLSLFAEWLFYMLTASTVFIFRRREPGADRPYRVWGYPVLPALFVAAAAFLLYHEFFADLRGSAAGALIILAGIPVFWFFKRRGRMVG